MIPAAQVLFCLLLCHPVFVTFFTGSCVFSCLYHLELCASSFVVKVLLLLLRSLVYMNLVTLLLLQFRVCNAFYG
jgi:hypothetical protein